MAGKALEIALMVKGVRLSYGLKRHRFADFLGISPAMVASLETGVRVPSVTLLMKLADIAKDQDSRAKLLEWAGITRIRVEGWFADVPFAQDGGEPVFLISKVKSGRNTP